MIIWRRSNGEGVRGTSLIEVMISVLVFSILIVALLHIFTQSHLMSKREELVYTAYSLAKNRVDMLKSISFSDLSASEETLTAINEDGEADSGGLYRRTTDITTSYSGDSDLTQITVDVYYTIRGALSTTPMKMTTVVYDG